MIIIAILPTSNPVNGDLKACRIPPSPDSVRAHNAVNLEIAMALFELSEFRSIIYY